MDEAVLTIINTSDDLANEFLDHQFGNLGASSGVDSFGAGPGVVWKPVPSNDVAGRLGTHTVCMWALRKLPLGRTHLRSTKGVVHTQARHTHVSQS